MQDPANGMLLPEYEVVDEEVYDGPGKTQVRVELVVSGNVTESTLQSLLRQKYQTIMKRRGFKYHNAPNSVYIYAYDTVEKAKAGQGLWLAMLGRSIMDGEPTITVRTEQLARLGEKPEERFGLSESERKEVFRALVGAEDQALKVAEETYPYATPETEAMKKLVELKDELLTRYRDVLAARYGLTSEQLESIGLEGLRHQWIMPPPE